MRPIILLPESHVTEKPPSWRQCLENYQQCKGDRQLDINPASKPARKTTRGLKIESVRSDGTKLSSSSTMTEKASSQDKTFPKALVTVTLKPHKTDNGETRYSCKVTSEKDKAGETERKPTPVDSGAQDSRRQGRSKRHSIDASLERLRHEMNSLRKQDVELLDQLLTLNDSIQDFKLSQAHLSDSLSDLSEISDESDVEDAPTNQWKFPASIQPHHINMNQARRRESMMSEDSDHVVSYRTKTPSLRRRPSESDSCLSDSGRESTRQADKARQWHSQVNLRSDNNAFSTGVRERPDARRNSTASHHIHSKTSGSKPAYAPKEMKRSHSQTSLASDCSGYGTGSSDRLSSRSNSPCFGSRRNSYAASDGRHKDMVYQFVPAAQKTTRSSSLSCVTGHAQGVSSTGSGACAAGNRTMFVHPSVTLTCCSGVRYAATRPLRSFTKRQSTIW